MRKISKALIAAGCAGTVLASAGMAWAYWGLSGSARASVTAGSAVQLQGTGNTFPEAPLYPGAAANLKISIQNDNAFAVVVRQITIGPGAIMADGPHAAAGCHHTGIALPPPPTIISWTAGRNATTSFVLVKGVRMTNESDSACQGATFTVPLALSGTSAS